MRQHSFPLPVSRKYLPGRNRQAESRRLIPVLVVVFLIVSVCSSLHAAPLAVSGHGVSQGRYLACGQTGRPGVTTRTLHNEPPAVMNSVFKSSPPNAQLVVSSRGIGMNSNN